LLLIFSVDGAYAVFCVFAKVLMGLYLQQIKVFLSFMMILILYVFWGFCNSDPHRIGFRKTLPDQIWISTLNWSLQSNVEAEVFFGYKQVSSAISDILLVVSHFAFQSGRIQCGDYFLGVLCKLNFLDRC